MPQFVGKIFINLFRKFIPYIFSISTKQKFVQNVISSHTFFLCCLENSVYVKYFAPTYFLK